MMRILKSAIKAALYPALMLAPKIRTPCPYKIFGSKKHHSFIGYYDIQPFDTAQKRLIAGRRPINSADTALEIGFYNLQGGDFITIDHTPLWSWQQGSRLQWVQWCGREAVMYHTLEGDNPISLIFDPDKAKTIATLPFTAFALSADGRYSASLDFGLLARHRPGYGYAALKPAAGQPDIQIHSLPENTLTGRVQLDAILSINPRPIWQDNKTVHYFNHLHFNPSGTRLMAFHIWEAAGQKRCVRALTMDKNGQNICDVTGSDHISHYAWIDDETLLFYGTDLGHGTGFHLYHQAGGYIRTLKNAPDQDGHPSQNPIHRRFLASDTVVNRASRRNLWLYDLEKNCKVDIGSFFSPAKFSRPMRCDLHPRWSPKGDLIAIDTAHKGFRQIAVLDVSLKIHEDL